jgi:hypothetical protein
MIASLFVAAETGESQLAIEIPTSNTVESIVAILMIFLLGLFVSSLSTR